MNDEGSEDRREVIERVNAGVLMSSRNSYGGRIRITKERRQWPESRKTE